MTAAALAVVVLNWNNASDTLECLRSLAASEEPVVTVVVDNGSVDGSAEEIERSGLTTHLLRTGRNLGYAGGNNVGLQHALAEGYECIAVLNNDTLVGPQAMGQMRRHVVESSCPLAINPVISYADHPASTWFAGGVMDRGWPRHLQAAEVSEAEGVLRDSEVLTGCCLVATGETWREVGLFDERFFLIFEDSDWSLRARQRGVRLAVATDSVIAHKVSRSFELGAMPSLGIYYFVRNGLRFNGRYARRHLLRFMTMWVLRPTVRRVRSTGSWNTVLFAWLGFLSAVTGQSGKAPSAIERLGQRISARDKRDVPTGMDQTAR